MSNPAGGHTMTSGEPKPPEGEADRRLRHEAMYLRDQPRLIQGIPQATARKAAQKLYDQRKAAFIGEMFWQRGLSEHTFFGGLAVKFIRRRNRYNQPSDIVDLAWPKA
jgi:hypothetical protein